MIVNSFLGSLIQRVIDLHYRRLVAAPVAVVRSGKDRDDALIVLPLVPLHNELVCSGDEVEAIDVGELFGNVLAEGVASPARRYAPAASVVGVGPDQVAHGSLVGHLLDAVEVPGMVEGVNGGAKSTVEAEDSVLHDGRHGEVVEGVGEVLPYVGVAVLSEAFVVEAVDLGDLATLVVAPEDGDAMTVPNLERHEERHGLQRVVSPIDVVAHEEVVRVGTRTADAEQFRQVVELPVNVTADCYWGLDGLYIGLLLQNFLRLHFDLERGLEMKSEVSEVKWVGIGIKPTRHERK